MNEARLTRRPPADRLRYLRDQLTDDGDIDAVAMALEATAADLDAFAEWLNAQKESAWAKWVKANDTMADALKGSEKAWQDAYTESQRCQAATETYNAVLGRLRGTGSNESGEG